MMEFKLSRESYFIRQMVREFEKEKNTMHDINQYGVTIQPKANTTLKAMTKAELIEYIRTLEHNYNVAVVFNERQARYIEAKLKEQKQGEWIYGLDEYDVEFLQCPLCDGVFYDGDNDTFDVPYNYCPNCGVKLAELKGTEE